MSKSADNRILHRRIAAYAARLVLLCLCGVALCGCRRRIAREDLPAPAATAPSASQDDTTPTSTPSAPSHLAPDTSEPPAPTDELSNASVRAEQAKAMSDAELLDATIDDEAANEADTAIVTSPAPLSTITPALQDATADANTGTITPDAPNTLAESVSADADSETNPANEGGAVGIILDASALFLRMGLGSLYECEKGNVYLETGTPYVTASRTSSLHGLITDAGGYNIAEKLQGNAPVVETDWVVRKNPNVIVKFTDALGAGVTSAAAAQAEIALLSSRPGWEAINAIVNRRIVVLSNELLASDEGRLLAKLYIAEAMYPVLFASKSVSSIAAELEAAGGRRFTNGLYAYSISSGL